VIWLGDQSGNLSDWTTQQWVRVTGRHIPLADHLWLDGPVGKTDQIGRDFFDSYAREKKLETVQSGVRGLIPDFTFLKDQTLLAQVAPPVREFYERTSEFDLDAWSEWTLSFGH
jgi:hypothetical protein